MMKMSENTILMQISYQLPLCNIHTTVSGTFLAIMQQSCQLMAIINKKIYKVLDNTYWHSSCKGEYV